MNRGLIEFGGLLLLLVGCIVLGMVSGRSQQLRADGSGYAPGHRRKFSLSFDRLRESVLRWTTTVDHKDIGLLYIAFGTFAALWGGMDAMMMRLELLTPPADVWSEQTYNALFTTHGLTMIFFFVLPVFFGIGNYFLPLLLGADDMAFPRVNAIGFWLLPPALLLARSGLFFQVGGQVLALVFPGNSLLLLQSLEEPAIGWTMYTPLSRTAENPQVTTLLLGLHLSGIASTVGAINFIATIVYERADDVTWANLDIFSWTMLTTSGLALFAFPLLGSALVMLILDRVFGTMFFAVDGGSPILWQHLFWFFGHPEVYIIFLPATGLLSFILPKFVGRKLFGFRYIVYSTLAIGVLSFGVWAHHMFTTSLDPRIQSSFMAVTLAIAVPSAIKVFNWLTTIYDGNVRLTAPMILCVGSIGTFVIGGITGVFLGSIPIDRIYHGTYYVVGHFHLIIMGIIPYMMMAASYYWYPIITGRMYDRRLAIFQSWLMIIGTSITFLTLVLLGMLDMPRRYANYPAEFATLQQIASIGGFLLGLTALLWLYNMVWSYWNGTPVTTADPWDLKKTEQFTREWQWFEQKLERKYDIEPTTPETTRPSVTTDTERGSPQVAAGVGQLTEQPVYKVGSGMLAGFVATLLMTVVLFSAVLVGMFDMSAFAALSSLVGFRDNATIGFALFLIGGTTVWPLLFLTLSQYLPGQLTVATGLTFATVTYIGFLIAFYTGQQGLALVGYIAIALIAHWMYGLVLAIIIEFFELRRRQRRA